MKATGKYGMIVVLAVAIALVAGVSVSFAGKPAGCTGVERQFIFKNATSIPLTASVGKKTGPRHYAAYESSAGNGQVDVTFDKSALNPNESAIGKYCVAAGVTIKLMHTEWSKDSNSIYCDGRPNAKVDGIGAYVCTFDSTALDSLNKNGRADLAATPQ